MTVYNTTQFVGTSGTSVSDAIRGAIERAAESLDDLQWFEVKEIRGRIEANEVAEYQVKLDIAYRLRAPAQTRNAGAAKGTTGSRETRSQAAQVARKAGQKKRSDLARGFEKQPTRKSQK